MEGRRLKVTPGKALLICLLLIAIPFMPVIPAYRISGPHFPGTFTKAGPIIGFGKGPCVEQMLVSIFYLFTGVGPSIVLRAGEECI
jgi:hypothetical protein